MIDDRDDGWKTIREFRQEGFFVILYIASYQLELKVRPEYEVSLV